MEMKKGKGVAIELNLLKNTTKESDDKKSLHSGRFSARNASSKYDFVKVKVWLGDNADHYYVLSRFLLSRMLTVTKIPNHVAIKIALELKKLLIDNILLDVSQSDLEANLFKLMERRGYGEEYIARYKMMTGFHHQRVPLVILVCGTACAGKSTIATQLAQRLNLPNVLQTDMVYELLRTSTEAPLVSTPVWARDFSSPEELITEFCRECRIVRKVSLCLSYCMSQLVRWVIWLHLPGLAGDLKKAMKDGKPIIIEGIHLDPSIYLMDDENRELTGLSTKNEDLKPAPLILNDDTALEKDTDITNICSMNVKSKGEIPDADQVTEDRVSLKSIIARTVPENQEETPKVVEANATPVKIEKSGTEPIIVPIVLKMAEFDHKV
ncbi:hypothetical protein GIB67_001216 [Kingdonia uniflora]|uniref:2-phosphoglycerate kinase n=1 Tax=Kingdonia uniflora TaxID=39325 RepID=A0A7J7LGN1_9MAGN|nr:hypothetical protein GIB67_001216 [Kingdonia uniflora]